jgi:hemerythrin-like metal-binding protein
MDNYVIAWSEALAVGDPTVDAQHRRLIEMIAGISDHESAADATLVPEVLDYAARHFREEESFMARIGYPALAAHRDEHKLLTRTFLAYKREYDEGKTDLYNMKHFLFRWVRDHVMDTDRQIGRYLAGGRRGEASEG